MKNSYTFYPSFEDLFRIIQAIAFCEDGKYPQGKGRKLLAEFLTDCVYETKFDFLAGKYNIPIRENEQVKNTNGAWKNKR